jgi:hypothetical protein
MEILRVVFIAACTVVAVIVLRMVIRSARRLDQRIAEFREELENQTQGPINPYLALAELYAEDERRNREARKKRKA